MLQFYSVFPPFEETEPRTNGNGCSLFRIIGHLQTINVKQQHIFDLTNFRSQAEAVKGTGIVK